MKKISYQKMADTIIAKRKEKKLTQAQLADMTGIHRAMVSRLEGLDYTPSIDQLQAIAEALGFEVTDLFVEDKPAPDKKYNSLQQSKLWIWRILPAKRYKTASGKLQRCTPEYDLCHRRK